MRRSQQDSMTIQELNELLEREVAQSGLRDRGETKLLGWLLDQQMLDRHESQRAGAQQHPTTIQELNELTERVALRPGIRDRDDSKLFDWVLEYQAA
jgi:hypothetical protein